jgi:6-pyruvoyltetrahydropterin/6-carboxytetrahydropterin synthase
VDPVTGMTIDFGDITSLVDERVIQPWDHRNLNDVFENPTAENIVVEIWRRIAGGLPGLKEIELWEMPDSSVVYRGESEGVSR